MYVHTRYQRNSLVYFSLPTFEQRINKHNKRRGGDVVSTPSTSLTLPNVPLFAGASALPSAAFHQVGYSSLWSGDVSWPFVDT